MAARQLIVETNVKSATAEGAQMSEESVYNDAIQKWQDQLDEIFCESGGVISRCRIALHVVVDAFSGALRQGMQAYAVYERANGVHVSA